MLRVPQGKVDRQELLLADTIIACLFFPSSHMTLADDRTMRFSFFLFFFIYFMLNNEYSLVGMIGSDIKTLRLSNSV